MNKGEFFLDVIILADTHSPPPLPTPPMWLVWLLILLPIVLVIIPFLSVLWLHKRKEQAEEPDD